LAEKQNHRKPGKYQTERNCHVAEVKS